MSAGCDFLLVVPAYSEQERLPAFLAALIEALADAPFSTTIQIVDDGSPDEARTSLLQKISSLSGKGSVALSAVRCEPHRGKGGAIRSGWSVPSTATWLAFVDADGAVPPSEIRRVFLDIVDRRDPGHPGSFVAVRRSAAVSSRERKWSRHFASWLFAWEINVLFQTNFSDTQCGFKIVSRRAWEQISARCLEDGFSFDVELLMRLRQKQIGIREVPIQWHEKPNGHFHLIKDGVGTLLRAIFLRVRLLAGG